MEWQSEGLPDETGSYLVSVMVNRKYGTSAFKYMAHFNSDEKKWYKYDPFRDEIGEELDGKVTAYATGTSVFLK